MFDETIFNSLNIALGAGVAWLGFQTAGKARLAGQIIACIGIVIAVAEFAQIVQIIPQGTILSELMYQKEVPILALLLLALNSLRSIKK